MERQSYKILNNYFGFKNFREGQEEIIDAIISGYEVLAVMPTGGGKSLCYQIPAIMGENQSIVISPMISLMKDQVDSLNENQRIAGFINSSQNYHEAEEVFRNLEQGKIKILYLSPEKISSKSFQSRLKKIKWDYLFVDEAHCISEWGHNFRPSYLGIRDFANSVGITNISAFTATATPEVRKDIITQLRVNNKKVFVFGFNRENLSLKVLETAKKKETLLKIVKQYAIPTIVYCATRKDTEEISFFLNSHNFNTAHYHAGLSSEARKKIQDDFYDDNIEIIVATNAFGMGIDKSNIRTIVHYSITSSLENYYQEIGRAGRDGKESNIFLLYSKKDLFTQKFLIESSFPNNSELKIIYNAINDFSGTAINSVNKNKIPISKALISFVRNLNIYPNKFDKSLEILENSNYLQILSPSENQYSIKFKITPTDLKKYIQKLANKDVSNVLTTIMRNYLSKPFTNQTGINLFTISKNSNLGLSKVKEILNRLDTIGILDFADNGKEKQIKFLCERINSEMLIFNTSDVDKNLAFQNQKLNEVIEFAESNTCRMKMITNYFGDFSLKKCGKCDNCLRSETSKIFFDEVIVNHILSFFDEQNISISQKNLIQFMKGDNKFEYESKGFGNLLLYSQEEIITVIQHLAKQNKLQFYGGLISKVGKELPNSGVKSRTKNNAEEVLRNKLLVLRKEVAKKFFQPEKMIIPDEIIEEIIIEKPKTYAQLLSINGFHQRMFTKIGEDILDIFRSKN